jgi:acetone carboxylase gamma subunit
VSKRAITEYLDLDPRSERWSCNRCGADLGSARENYKKGCLIAAREPADVHPQIVEGAAYSFAPDRDWCRIVEFYCPNCGTLIETEYLPPGHPLTHDIELDIDALKAKDAAEELSR